MKIKLPKAPTADPVERVSFSLRKSSIEMINAYRDAYEDAYGEKINLSSLVEDMLKGFMSEDKAFMKFFQQRQKEGAPSRPSAEREEEKGEPGTPLV